ncbi:MAG: undecaprenyl-diphosphate phosphatase [Oscillospiraceae bacterium]|jgi:undecaprenyl-diphosphatase|nr:undecaprenyl-diphosphate phosphatase [Oscillospiraceae bacterium]
MDILFGIIQGVVQGLTEFLPVSSSGHLAFLQNEFGINGESDDMLLTVLLHLGTLVSVIIYYRKDISDILRHLTKRRIVPLVIIATIPLLGAVLLKDYVEVLYHSTLFIGIMWIVTGVMLILGDAYTPGKARKDEEHTKFSDALIVGIVQGIAILPGLSRSGSTITAGTLRGLDRKFAVRLSFLMSIPAILGANVLEIKDAVAVGIETSKLPTYAAGVVAAAVSGYLAIRLIDWVAEKAKFKYFGMYCLAIGIAAIVLGIIK